MSVGLLDVNMLIALAWPSHVHHGITHEWFASKQKFGWATCPLTQCAFVRISSNSRIIPEAVEPVAAIALLQELVALKHHVFWPDAVPFGGNSVPTELLVGHRQVMDAYLLGLAIHEKGKLVTLDRGIAALLPTGSTHVASLEILTDNGE